MANDLDLALRQLIASLPPLAAKLAEIEAVLQRPVVFQVDLGLAGQARGKATCPQGHVHLASESANDLSVVGEEIMHLHRCTRGYPTLVPGDHARVMDYDQGVQALNGFFDEHATFPFLENMGLDPRSHLTGVLDRTLGSLEGQLAHIEEEGYSERLRVTLGAVYVQAALMAPRSPTQDRLLSMFNSAPLSPYRVVGQSLCAAIDLAVRLQPDGVEKLMDECLRNVLRLPDGAATVKRWF